MAINRLALDLYSGDRVTDFGAIYDSSIRLIIHKASEGATVQDAEYAKRRVAAQAAGLMWAAYHYGRGTDVEAQVANFLSAAKPDPDTRLVLDWEVASMSMEQARAFLQAVDAKMGRPTILYSYSSFLREQMGSRPDAFFGARPLWIAAYSNVPPIPQASWAKPLLWQYTDGEDGPGPHAVPGITGPVDSNHFDGTEAELRAAFTGQGDAPAPVIPAEPWDTPGWHLFDDPRLAWAQSRLNSLQPGRPALVVDGLDGPNTKAAVMAFQLARKLGADGVVGPLTVAAIKALSN